MPKIVCKNLFFRWKNIIIKDYDIRLNKRKKQQRSLFMGNGKKNIIMSKLKKHILWKNFRGDEKKRN